jgi:hypothetical protein
VRVETERRAPDCKISLWFGLIRAMTASAMDFQSGMILPTSLFEAFKHPLVGPLISPITCVFISFLAVFLCGFPPGLTTGFLRNFTRNVIREIVVDRV